MQNGARRLPIFGPSRLEMGATGLRSTSVNCDDDDDDDDGGGGGGGA